MTESFVKGLTGCFLVVDYVSAKDGLRMLGASGFTAFFTSHWDEVSERVGVGFPREEDPVSEKITTWFLGAKWPNKRMGTYPPRTEF